MVDVIANERGYYGGELRDAGERFSVPDEIMKDKKRRPSWVRLAAFGGKGDHDGDGLTGGAVPDQEAKELDGMTVAEMREYADENGIDLGGATKKADVLEALKAGKLKAEPFADAPEPVSLAEAQKQQGGVEPDWIAPDEPQPVTD